MRAKAAAKNKAKKGEKLALSRSLERGGLAPPRLVLKALLALFLR